MPIETRHVMLLAQGEGLAFDPPAGSAVAYERPGSVAAALSRLYEERFDAVVLDAVTVASPRSVARSVHEQAPTTPIVMLTAGNGAMADRSRTAGADGVECEMTRDGADAAALELAVELAIERARSRETEAALREAQRELRAAWAVQQNLYPTHPPRIAGYDIAGVSHPAGAIGGDYFDFFPMSGGRLGLAIGDASGHGIGSALIMAQTSAALRSLSLTLGDPAAVLTAANRVLSQGMLDKHFVTMMLAAIDPLSRQMHYASAGHPPAMIFDRRGRPVRDLPSTGFPLGVIADSDIPLAGPVHLEPGQSVLLFTDGVTEAAAHRDEVSFGLDRVVDAFERLHTLAAAEIADALHERVLTYCHPRTPHDDVTVIVIRVHDV